MRVATLDDGTRDGRLIVVSRDGGRFVAATAVAARLQAALDDWERAAPALRALSTALESGELGESLLGKRLLAPLPRSYQWIDASGYLSHLERVRRARGVSMPDHATSEPVIYQGLSDRNLAWNDDLPSADGWGTDVEAEIAVVTGDVPARPTRRAALDSIRLVVLVNDVSLRTLIPPELAKGFGFFHGKPASAFGAFAVTPDELGDGWIDGRVRGDLDIRINRKTLGRLRTGVDQHFDFADIIQYATRTRSLGAGTIVGAGTVSNRDESRGVACIAERRVLEQLRGETALSSFLAIGDEVEIEFTAPDGRAVLGTIRQRVVDAIDRAG